MKDAERELAKLSKDNYTATLPIYNYPDKTELGPCLPHLDRTIEKSSKAIHKHSMMIKGKEYVKTIDDAYFLMAKSYFYNARLLKGLESSAAAAVTAAKLPATGFNAAVAILFAPLLATAIMKALTRSHQTLE